MNITSCVLNASKNLPKFLHTALHVVARGPQFCSHALKPSCILQALIPRLTPSFFTPSRTVLNGPLYRPPIDYTDDQFWRIRDNLKPKKKKGKKRPLDGHPFMKGVVLKTLIRNPRKPNSGNRKCVLVRLRNGKEKLAKIPGEGHNLQEHHVVLLMCGKTQDTPGLHIKVMRGKYDCAPVVKKKPI